MYGETPRWGWNAAKDGLAGCLCAAAVKMPVGTLYVPQCPGGGGGGVCCILLATSDLRV